VVLNTTSDHLDYHADKKEYHAAKAQFFKNQTPDDIAVYNTDYPTCLKIVSGSRARKVAVSTKKNVKEGAQLKGKKILLKLRRVPSGYHEAKLGEENVELMSTNEVGLLGVHNLENVLPSVLVASLLDVSSKTIRKAVQHFKGLPHRLEHVATRKGVDYYNDSFSTTPETSVAGVQAFKKPVHLIAGGSEKYSDFRGWAKACMAQKNLKTLFLTGNASAVRMAQALQKVKPARKSLKIVRVEKLADAVAQAKKITKSGQVVLLSPACASFEEFPNYKVRGETFRELAAS
jgi:UDP-N-acetylmuramoylalanine--D-glutamate ligase